MADNQGSNTAVVAVVAIIAIAILFFLFWRMGGADNTGTNTGTGNGGSIGTVDLNVNDGSDSNTPQ